MTTARESFDIAAEVEMEDAIERAEADAQWALEEEQYQAECATWRAELDRKAYLDGLQRGQEMLDARRPAEWARDVQMMDNWSRANGLR